MGTTAARAESLALTARGVHPGRLEASRPPPQHFSHVRPSLFEAGERSRVRFRAMIPRKKLVSADPSLVRDRRQILSMLDERMDAVTLAELRKNPPPLRDDSDENGKASGGDRDDVMASMARRLVRVPSESASFP